jgi:anaerobic selenocysteine-containing dehydrogenase
VCPKASAIVDVQHDPDRRTRPLKRVGSEWVEIAWDTVFDEIAERIARIQERHGNDAVAYYRGNPLVHSYSATQVGALNDILDERLFDAPSGTASLGGMEVSVTRC